MKQIKQQKKYDPTPKNSFEKGLFKRFEQQAMLKQELVKKRKKVKHKNMS